MKKNVSRLTTSVSVSIRSMVSPHFQTQKMDEKLFLNLSAFSSLVSGASPMKITPMRQKMTLLREAINLPLLDQMERMLNNSKGTGTTNSLIEIAKSQNLPILVESEKVAEELHRFHPEVKFLPFSSQLPGQRVLIDVSCMWIMLREAQKVRRLGEDLLNWMETKNANW